MKKNEEIIAGIKRHQSSNMVHPLTCGNAACRAVLEAFEDDDKKVKLGCVPIVIMFKIIFRHVWEVFRSEKISVNLACFGI